MAIPSISRNPIRIVLRRLALAVLLAFVGLGVHAQALTGVKINPLSIFLLTANIQVEHPISDRFSLQFGAFAGSPSMKADTNLSPDKVHYTWFGLTPELRYYPRFAKKAAPEGFYLAAYFRFRYLSRKWTGPVYAPSLDSTLIADNQQQIPAAGMGGMIGFQFLIKKKMALDLYAGPQFLVSSPVFQAQCASCAGNERPAGKIGPAFMGMEMRAGISLGYFF